MDTLVVAVVLPSLNEEATLWSTCKSLGFSTTSPPAPGTFLFIVDNDSTDRTLEVAREIQRGAPRGVVFIGQDKERGYVPPRHTGNILVEAFAQAKGLSLSKILILQADADTSYDEGYIEQMRNASQTCGPNYLVEGLAEFSRGFRESFPEYVNLSSKIDARVLSLLPPLQESDLICTDAVCGYRLSDYLAWGGHLREYGEGGIEIHAETTRLYMRARSRGARKLYVERALGYPSERKIVSRPIEELATAGFPRTASWKALWKGQRHGSPSLRDFHKHLEHPAVLHAIRLRERHLVALFGLLPLHVARALSGRMAFSTGTTLGEIAASLPAREAEALSQRPAVFLTDVLKIVDHHGVVLSKVIEAMSGTNNR